MSTQEEITIAKMVLAGWRFEPIKAAPHNSPYGYYVVRPDGLTIGTRSTRYTAALAALQFMEEGVGLPR